MLSDLSDGIVGGVDLLKGCGNDPINRLDSTEFISRCLVHFKDSPEETVDPKLNSTSYAGIKWGTVKLISTYISKISASSIMKVLKAIMSGSVLKWVELEIINSCIETSETR